MIKYFVTRTFIYVIKRFLINLNKNLVISIHKYVYKKIYSPKLTFIVNFIHILY